MDRLERRKALGRSPQVHTAIRSWREVAEQMAKRGYPMSVARVYQIERRALRKLYCGLLELREEVGKHAIC